MSDDNFEVAGSKEDATASIEGLSFDFQKLYLKASLDQALIDSLGKCLENIEGDTDAVDGILKQFITRTNLKCKVALFKCLAKALKGGNKKLSEHLIASFLKLSRHLDNVNPTVALAKNIIFLLKLLSSINVFGLDEKFLRPYVETHANFSSFFARADAKNLNIRSYECLDKFWRGLSIEQLKTYHTILNELSTTTSKLSYAIHWNNIFRFDTEAGHAELIAQHKNNVIDLFGKAVVQSKVKVVDIVGVHVFEHLISQCTLEDFKDKLFPLMQKSILRSAEVSLSLLALVFTSTKFDLDSFTQDIVKLLGSYSISKDEVLQNETLATVAIVSTKCTTLEAIKFLVDYFVKIYNGSMGKLAVPNQKTIVLKIVAALANNKVQDRPAMQPVFNFTLDELIKIVKQETVEANIVAVIVSIKQWLLHAEGLTLPESFWKYFKEQRKAKSNTPLIQSMLYECLLVYFGHDTNLASVNKLDADSINSIVNSSKHMTLSISKVPVLSESLYAASLLLRILPNLEAKPKTFVDALNNFESILFLGEKFISETTSESVQVLVQFLELVATTSFFADSQPNKIVFSRALVHLMCHGVHKAVRSTATKLYSKLAEKDKQLVAIMVNTFYELYSEATPTTTGGGNEIDDHMLAKFKCCAIIIKSISGEFNEDQAGLYINVLKVSHIWFVYKVKPELYPNFISQHFEDSADLVLYFDTYLQTFIDLVINSSTPDPIKLNIVRSFAFLIPHRFIESLVRLVTNSLEQQANGLKAITTEDLAIARAPAGELVNTAAVLQAADNTVDKNMKRESKLYSYKEQMADLELRKELEKKNKAEMVLDVKKLSKKQAEVYKQELAKEEATRARVQSLQHKFTFNIELLESMIESNGEIAVIYYKDLIYTLVSMLSSVVAHDKLSNFITKLRKPMMLVQTVNASSEYTRFMDTVAHTLVRVYQNPEEVSEELCSVITRLVGYLHKRTCPPASGQNYDEKLVRLAKENRLTTSAFSYVFPLLRHLLLSLEEKTMSDYDDNVGKCLDIIVQHSMLRNKEGDFMAGESLSNPQHLPIKQLFETLIKFMTTNAMHEKQAAGALISVVKSVTGESGCGHATSVDLFVLFANLTHTNELIRLTCFEAMFLFSANVIGRIHNEHFQHKLTHRVFVGTFDPNEECQQYAHQIFEKCKLATSGKLLEAILVEDVENANSVLLAAVPEAYKHLVPKFPEELANIYERLVKSYEVKARASIPVVDAFGRLLSKNHVDVYEPRLTIAHIFKNIVEYFTQNEVEQFITFLIPGALGDNNEHVRSGMLEAGCQLIDHHHANNITFFLDVFETYLDSAHDDHRNDLVRKSVIILMGTLAKHIDGDNPKLKPILGRLVEALSTPSQIVQEAVANCLQYLIPKFKEDAPALLQKLLQLLFESEVYGERKGAAYGIAGIVKGLGILSLNKLGIMEALTQAIRSKDRPNNREGALFAFEMLSNMLGRLFEPYIVHILPDLLDCFGDSSSRVRQAADDTAKVIMSKLSAPGVTLIYPTILQALEDDSWRKKTSSIELLGSMAFCAPKQLSQCLPKIVPKLMTVIIDSHPKVQKAAAHALKQIGSVIKNPEIQEIVPILLEALQDPTNKTNKCLSVMLNMKFVHVVDPPSLALIMPVIERAFQNRSTETRKMASQIIGNMYALTKSKDLSPYLRSILPGLQNSLLDPVPEVRSVTSRALGAMVKGLGNELLADLMPWLKAMLISEVSSVDRSGAAQGLAEVIGGLGIETLVAHMPEIIAITERTDVPSHVKDGYIMLFIYLPLVFTQQFVAYIPQVINPILQALADENEYVRETALRAGQCIVNMYADTAIQLLLPELEKGLFDENWRIRYCSVQLLGDLLFKIIGVSGKMTTESGHEDDNFGTEQSHKAIYEALGDERHNYVLSGLYMCRSDVALQVRQASLHVWKVIVSNTPRTLKEILPVLFSLLLSGLASNSNDHQQCAARTLGDLVRKLGERILPEIIPIIEQGLRSDRPDQRQGVCIGLCEIIASTSREMVQAFADNLIPTIKRALSDNLPEVRLVAARAFDQLYSAIGNKALEDILPDLVNKLDDPSAGERTLDSIKNIISFKSKVVLPYLIPKLTVPPANTRALSLISSVAGDSLSKHLSKIIPALLEVLIAAIGTDSYDQHLGYCQDVVLSITDELGSTQLVMTLLDKITQDPVEQRRVAVALLVTYSVQAKPHLIAGFRSPLLRGLILMLAYDDQVIISQCVDAINAIIKGLAYKEQLDLIPEVRNALRHAISDHKSQVVVMYGEVVGNRKPDVLPGFATNKGILPLLNLFKEAFLNTNADVRYAGALGYKEVIDNSSTEALQPSVMTITGSLLRVIGERISCELKVLVIDVLSILLLKVGTTLKPFLPQIQAIFFRSLSDTNRVVRLQAATCIGRFASVCVRLEQFFNDLVSLIRKCPIDATHMHDTGYYALRLAMSTVKDKFPPTMFKQMLDFFLEERDNTIDTIRIMAAACLGMLVSAMPGRMLVETFDNYLYDDDDVHPIIRHFGMIAIQIVLKEAFDKVFEFAHKDMHHIRNGIIRSLQAKETYLVLAGIRATAYYIDGLTTFDPEIYVVPEFVTAYAKTMNNSNNDVKQTLAKSVIYWSSKHRKYHHILIELLVPRLVNGTKERNNPVRIDSEQALISLLKLKEADSEMYKVALKYLNEGASQAMEDTVAKIKKSFGKFGEYKEEEFDDTLVMC